MAPTFASEADARRAWDDAVALAKEGRYATALAIFQRIADNGYYGAAYAAANLLERGAGDLPSDLGAAEQWYARAADEDGDLDAKFDLARIILRRNELHSEAHERAEQAVQLLTELAKGGHIHSIIFLGLLYLEGRDVPRDPSLADNFLQQAARRKFVVAILKLSRLEFAKGHLLQGLTLRLRAFWLTLSIMRRNPNDPRLSYVHAGYKTGDENFKGWREAGPPPRLD
jgi:TPR repeat protein